MSEEILAGVTDEFIARIGTIEAVYNQWQLIHAEDKYSVEVWFYDDSEYYLDVSGKAETGYQWELVKWDNPNQGRIADSHDNFNLPPFFTLEAAKENAKLFWDWWVSAGRPARIPSLWRLMVGIG